MYMNFILWFIFRPAILICGVQVKKHKYISISFLQGNFIARCLMRFYRMLNHEICWNLCSIPNPPLRLLGWNAYVILVSYPARTTKIQSPSRDPKPRNTSHKHKPIFTSSVCNLMWLILPFQHDHFVDPSTRYLLVQGIEAAKLCNDWTLHGWTTRAVPCVCWCLVLSQKVSRTYASNIRWMWNFLDGCGWRVIDIWWHDVVCHQLVAAVFPGLCKPNPQELVSRFKIRWLEWCWNVHAYLSHTSWKTSPILTIPDMFFKPFHTIHRAFETLWRRNPTTQIWKLHVSAHVKSKCESTAMLRVFFLSTMTFGRKASLPHEIVPASLDFHVSPGWLPSIWIQLFGLQWWPLADSTPLKEPVG